MARIDTEHTDERLTENHSHREAHEEEVNLIDYFLVIWKYKWFIAVLSTLSFVLTGLFFSFTPRTYEVSYIYDNLNPDPSEYIVLTSQIYCRENLDKIADRFQKEGLGGHTEYLRNGGKIDSFLRIEPFPPYIVLSESDITDPGQIRQIQSLKSQQINMTLTAPTRDDLFKIASVIRDNFEKTVPLYSLRREVAQNINFCRTYMADIEANKFEHGLTLAKNRDILASLSKIRSGVSDNGEDNIMLQFDVGQESQYLPLGYQLRAVEAKIIELEKESEVDTINYKYHEQLLQLNKQLYAELQKGSSSSYTTDDFLAFLTQLNQETANGEIKDYLSSYAKHVENKIFRSAPVTENPVINTLARGTVKKCTKGFLVAFAISVLVSFIREGVSHQAKLSAR